MSDERPDYIKCILDTHAEAKGPTGGKLSWCGKELWSHDWAFVSVDHAAMNGRDKGRLVSCPECAKAVIEALREGE